MSRGRGGRGSYPLWVLNWIFGLFKRGECPVKGATSKWKRRNQRGPARRVGLVARVNGEVEACTHTSSVRIGLVRVSVREREGAKTN